MTEELNARPLGYTLRRDEWPLVVQALRLEGSARSLQLARQLENWLQGLDAAHAVFLDLRASVGAKNQ